MFPLQQINYNIKFLLHIQTFQRARTDKLYPSNQRKTKGRLKAGGLKQNMHSNQTGSSKITSEKRLNGRMEKKDLQQEGFSGRAYQSLSLSPLFQTLRRKNRNSAFMKLIRIQSKEVSWKNLQMMEKCHSPRRQNGRMGKKIGRTKSKATSKASQFKR